MDRAFDFSRFAASSRKNQEAVLREQTRESHCYVGCHGRTRITQSRVAEVVAFMRNAHLSGANAGVPSFIDLYNEPNPYVATKTGLVPSMNDSRGIFEGEISNAEAQSSILRHAAHTDDNVNKLRALMNLHAPVVEKTLAKKDLLKTLLRAKMPKMPSASFWQLAAVQGEEWWLEAREQRNAWLLPHLTLDRFSNNAHAFLDLVKERIESSPEALYQADLENLRFGFCVGAFDLQRNPMAVLLTSEARGTLVDMPNNGDQATDRVPFPIALLIFEAQSVLSDFLLKFITGALKEAGVKVELSSLPVLDNQAAAWVQARALEAQVIALRDSARARQQEAHDDMWLAQTDTDYAHQAVSMGMAWKLDKHREGDAPGAKWAAAAAHFTIGIRERVQGWRCVGHELDHVLDVFSVCSQTGVNTEPGQSPPPELSNGLACLDLLLAIQIDVQRDRVSQRLTQQKLFQRFYTFGARNGTLTASLDLRAALRSFAPSEKDDLGALLFQESPLFHCLYQLAANGDDPLVFPTDLLFARFDDEWKKASKKDRARIDAGLLRDLDDLRTIVNMRRSIASWSRACPAMTITQASEHRSGAAFWDWIDTPQRKAANAEAKAGLDRSAIVAHDVELGKLLKNFSDAKVPKEARDVEYYQKRLGKRDKLAAFFCAARERVKTYCLEQHFSEQGIQDGVELLSQGLTPEHLEEVVQEQAALTAMQESLAKYVQKPSFPHLPGNFVPSFPRNSHKDQAATSKKTKTRKAPAEGVKGPPPHQGSTSDTKPPALPSPKVAVKAASLRILQAMLPSLRGERSPGHSVRWNDLISVLAEAGARASEGEGARVAFTVAEAGEGESRTTVILDRPHPRPEVTALMLRMIGKRLKKWFGWVAEDFEEKK